MKRKSIFGIWHTILLALYPVLFLYYNNINELNFKSVILLLIFVFILSLAWFFIILWITKDIRKTSIIVSSSLILFFSYGYIKFFLEDFVIGDFIIGRHRYLFIPYLILIGAVLVYLKNTRYEQKIAHFLKIFSAVLMGLLIFNIISFKVKNPSISPIFFQQDIQVHKETIASELPDIYYIVPDGYGNSRFIEKHFDFDNSDFEQFLREKGFYIPEDSSSNHESTFFSLASTLNMDYLTSLTEVVSEESEDLTILRKIIENSEVVRIIKDHGYKFVNISSGYSMTDYIKTADEEYRASYFNRFARILARTSMIAPFLSTDFRQFVGLDSDGKDTERKRVAYSFDKLKEIQKTETPKFILAHIVSPHEPFIFDSEGKNLILNLKSHEDLPRPDYFKYYLDQHKFINLKLKEVVSGILARSENVIIIIQSDHGLIQIHESFKDLTEKDRIRGYVKNFSAIYFAGRNPEDIFPKEMSNVNTFRYLFKELFKIELDILPVYSYGAGDKGSWDFRQYSEEQLAW